MCSFIAHIRDFRYKCWVSVCKGWWGVCSVFFFWQRYVHKRRTRIDMIANSGLLEVEMSAVKEFFLYSILTKRTVSCKTDNTFSFVNGQKRPCSVLHGDADWPFFVLICLFALLFFFLFTLLLVYSCESLGRTVALGPRWLYAWICCMLM